MKMTNGGKFACVFLIMVFTVLFMQHIWITDLAISEWTQAYQECKYSTNYIGMESQFTNGFYSWDLVQGYHVAMYEGFTAFIGLAMVAICFIVGWDDERKV